MGLLEATPIFILFYNACNTGLLRKWNLFPFWYSEARENFVFAIFHAALSALRSYCSQRLTRSDTSHSRSVTPAAIAGVMRSVR